MSANVLVLAWLATGCSSPCDYEDLFEISTVQFGDVCPYVELDTAVEDTGFAATTSCERKCLALANCIGDVGSVVAIPICADDGVSVRCTVQAEIECY